MPSTLRSFPLGDRELTLRVSDEAFQPTSTTQKFAEEVAIPEGARVLDLGCGVGPLAIYAALAGASHVTAIDIVPQAVEHATENVERAGVADRVTVICGDLYEPVKGQKFDVIVNDASGIADRVARLSTWYPDNIPTGGEDGSEVVIRVIDHAQEHLVSGGSLYFATASLSNAPKIMEHAHAVHGDRVQLLKGYRFPFSPELAEHIEELEKLRDTGIIDFESRKTRHLWTLNIYRVTMP